MSWQADLCWQNGREHSCHGSRGFPSIPLIGVFSSDKYQSGAIVRVGEAEPQGEPWCVFPGARVPSSTDHGRGLAVNLSRLLGAAATLIVLAVFLVSARTSFALQVIVTDRSDGTTLPGAKVTITAANGSAQVVKFTGSSGVAEFGLEDQEDKTSCDVVVQFPGFMPEVLRSIPLHGGQSKAVHVELREFVNVSLLRLITDPQGHDGVPVAVSGFVVLDFENHGLYVREEDWRNGITKNAVWLDLDPREHSRFNKQFVTLQGLFQAQNRGHMALYSGALVEVQALVAVRH